MRRSNMGWARFPLVVRSALLSVAFILAVAASGALALMLENHADAARAATVPGMPAADAGQMQLPATSFRTPAAVAAGFAERWKAASCDRSTWPHLDSKCLWARGQKHRHARVLPKQRRPMVAAPAQPTPTEPTAAQTKVTTSTATGASPSKTSAKQASTEKTEKTSLTGKGKQIPPAVRWGSAAGATY
jgi:hypothetical protein